MLHKPVKPIDLNIADSSAVVQPECIELEFGHLILLFYMHVNSFILVTSIMMRTITPSPSVCFV
jgi:hypothetical protein